MPKEPVRHRWAEMTADFPMPKLDRKRIIGEKMMLSLVRLDKGCLVPTHAHENEQLTCVLKGCLRFTLGAEGAADRKTVDVRADEVLHLPSGAPHAAEALEETLVLDCFSPPSAGTGIDRRTP